MPNKPTRRQIAETNEAMLRRQQQFRLAAEYAAGAFAGVPSGGRHFELEPQPRSSHKTRGLYGAATPLPNA